MVDLQKGLGYAGNGQATGDEEADLPRVALESPTADKIRGAEADGGSPLCSRVTGYCRKERTHFGSSASSRKRARESKSED